MKISRNIYITTQFEGIHRYLDAPESVSFLRNYHRHLFKVKLQIEVFHNERDIEFILFKHEIDKYIQTYLQHNKTNLSCESIAEWILQKVTTKYTDREVICEVSEDGENGAILKNEVVTC